MRIRLIKTCEFGDKGDVIDPDEQVARLIIGRELAEEVEQSEKQIIAPPADKMFKGKGRVTK